MKTPIPKPFMAKIKLMTLAFAAQLMTLGMAMSWNGSPGEIRGEKSTSNSGLADEKTNQQEVSVRGTVTDDSGEPIPGATVSVAGTTIGTATDLDGHYNLTVPDGSTLIFSFIGYVTQTISV